MLRHDFHRSKRRVLKVSSQAIATCDELELEAVEDAAIPSKLRKLSAETKALASDVGSESHPSK